MKHEKVGDIITCGNDEYVLLSTIYENNENSVAALQMLGQVKVYWLGNIYNGKCVHADLVERVSTIYGACPSLFGVKLNREKD